MRKFELVLKNEKIKQYQLFALLIILINVLFFAILAVQTGEYKIRNSSIFSIALIIAGFIFEYFGKKRNKGYSGKGAAVLFIVITYLRLQYWWPAVLITALAILYVISIRQLIIYVTPAQIIYPSFPKRIIHWSELNNMILKDGLLTIDFKNNKLAQVQVINGENDYRIDEKEFNEFCSMQLNTRTVVI